MRPLTRVQRLAYWRLGMNRRRGGGVALASLVLTWTSGTDYTRRPVLDFTGAVRGTTTARGAYDGV